MNVGGWQGAGTRKALSDDAVPGERHGRPQGVLPKAHEASPPKSPLLGDQANCREDAGRNRQRIARPHIGSAIQRRGQDTRLDANKAKHPQRFQAQVGSAD